MLLLSGNIKPFVRVEHSTIKATKTEHIVTKAKGSIVYDIDGAPAIEYIQSMGLVTDKRDVVLDFCGTPFLAKMKMAENDNIEVLRCLGILNHTKKYCGFLGKIEEGSEINMVLLSKEDIERSVKSAFDEVLQEIESSTDYQYSMILCSSCSARYCMIVADKNIEGRAYVGRLPDGVTLQGVYSYGEFSPVKGSIPGSFYNILNNETLAILAI